MLHGLRSTSYCVLLAISISTPSELVAFLVHAALPCDPSVLVTVLVHATLPYDDAGVVVAFLPSASFPVD